MKQKSLVASSPMGAVAIRFVVSITHAESTAKVAFSLRMRRLGNSFWTKPAGHAETKNSAWVTQNIAFFDPNVGEFWFESRASFFNWFSQSFWYQSMYAAGLSGSYAVRSYVPRANRS
ncbi:YopT-type cysteine protease domain-containing protein [uncultured Microbulbifer sp.]|uniref:YopT-type cysteine protease domain-containing protein n=1 Tax=uncultured Microbulbifer sp. TaxID=348147 RepID=UPI0026231A69|nr:YopT-type cysteine protease domain-containing protein [uncultured Microbulbifer sp.]